MKPLLVVGAGFAGAVHARELAEAGYKVHVIDQRPHLAGNAYDYVDDNGIRIHAYGPHLFHTKLRHVIAWIGQFSAFVPYTHKVRVALPHGGFAPLPINLDTVNIVFNKSFTHAAQVQDFLRDISIPNDNPINAAEYLHSKIGTVLTELFFRPYTKKMWDLDLEQMPASVMKRLPLRLDKTDTYFPLDHTQMLPAAGYTKLFETIFGHPNITLTLNKRFVQSEEKNYAFCFNAMAIDEYHDFIFGELPYRSLRFHHRTVQKPQPQNWSVTNYTDCGPFTRETAWHVLPGHVVRDTGRVTLTREEPCDYRDNNNQRFYPVKKAGGDSSAIYQKYRMLAEQNSNICFIGRCGTYQYLDMDQVISQSLTNVQNWLKRMAVRPHEAGSRSRSAIG